MRKQNTRGPVPILAVVALVSSVVGGSVWGVLQLTRGAPPPAPKVQQISVVQPPPPKPPEEKPPEEKPPEQKIETPVETPVEKSDEPPPAAQPLDVGNGDSPYGQGGGKNLIPGDGNGTGSRFGWYAGQIERVIQESLSRNAKVAKSDYRVIVKLWVNPDGTVRQVELASPSGIADLDAAIEDALHRLSGLREPPEDMPQPLKLRITSR